MAARFRPSLIALLLLAACNDAAVTAHQTNGVASANAATAAAPAAAPAAASSAACSFSGWSSDLDPRGLNVRAGPSTSDRVVGALPPPESHPDNETAFGATFDVVESRNGYFRIRNAHRWSDAGGGASTLPEGWISGRYLTFQLMTDKVFAEPRPDAPVVLTSWDEDGTLMQFRYRNPTECRGEWVRLTVIGRDGRERQGWVRGICGIQETTCDGVRGDLLSEDTNRGWNGMD
jgi:hypothetical protein